MFNQLNSLANLAKNRNQPRHDQSEKQLIAGMCLLNQVHEEQFANPMRLQEACRLLIEAIKFKRTDIRPYLSLAYIFLILEDHMTALKYIKPALAMEPNNPTIRDFQQQIAAEQQRVQQRRQERIQYHQQAHPSLEPVTTDDYDALYDQVEAQIRQAVRQVMMAPVPAPALASKGIVDIASQLDRYQQEIDAFQAQLKVIDAEIDIADLTRLLKPLEANLKRYQKLVAVSQVFRQLADQLREELEMVKQIIEEAQKTKNVDDIAILEENLEVLLENAYRHDQELSHHKKQGYPTAALESLYADLYKQIENYQEVLDETLARLQNEPVLA